MLRWTFSELHRLNRKVSIKTKQLQGILEKSELDGGEGIQGLEICFDPSRSLHGEAIGD